MPSLRTAALAVALAGCARTAAPSGPARPAPAAEAAAAPAPPPPPLDRDYPRLAARAVELYRAIAGAFDAAGEDCATAAARLAALTDEYREIVDANIAVVRDGRTRELAQALAAHADVLDPAARAIVSSPTLAACHADAAFTTAFDTLVGGPPPAAPAGAEPELAAPAGAEPAPAAIAPTDAGAPPDGAPPTGAGAP